MAVCLPATIRGHGGAPSYRTYLLTQGGATRATTCHGDGRGRAASPRRRGRRAPRRPAARVGPRRDRLPALAQRGRWRARSVGFWAGVPYPVIFNSTTPVCRGGDAHGRGARCTLGHATYNAPQWCPVADPSKDDHIVPYDNHGLSGRNGQVRRARTAARATPCVRKTVTRSRCSPRSHPCALFRQACYWFS
jgi:hypothetical protein